jgi:hypothetical protein
VSGCSPGHGAPTTSRTGSSPTPCSRAGGNPADAARLVEVGLWTAGEKDGETGWFFHEWDERQPTKAEVQKERLANAERIREWRRKKRESEAKRSA